MVQPEASLCITPRPAAVPAGARPSELFRRNGRVSALHWWVPAKRVIRPGHHAPRGGCYEPGVSGIDRRALAQPGLREAFLTGYSEAFRQGSRGVAQDLRVLMRPWGFELGSITVPASIHHGDADTTVPPQHARLFA